MTPEEVLEHNRSLILTVLDEHEHPIGLTGATIQARLFVDHDTTLSIETVRNHLNRLEAMGWATRCEHGDRINTDAWRLSDLGRKALHSREKGDPR